MILLFVVAKRKQKWSESRDVHQLGAELKYVSPDKKRKVNLLYSAYNNPTGKERGLYIVNLSKSGKLKGSETFKTKKEAMKFAKSKMKGNF